MADAQDGETKRRRTVAESDEEEDNEEIQAPLADVPGLRRVPKKRKGDGGDGDDDDFDDDAPPSDEEEGEDLLENAEQDYQHIAELDTYDESMLDNRTNLRRLDAQGRREVEAELDIRDNREEQLDRFAAGGSDNEEEEDRQQRRGGFAFDRDDMEGDDFQDVVDINLDGFDCSLQEHLANNRTRRGVMAKLKEYLMSPDENGIYIYGVSVPYLNWRGCRRFQLRCAFCLTLCTLHSFSFFLHFPRCLAGTH